MKKHLALLVATTIIMLAAGAPVLAADADDLLGRWLTPESEDGRVHVEFTKTGGKYSGAIVWLEKPTYPDDDEEGMAGQPKVDRENPDPKLRKRPIIGLAIAEGFTFDGDDLWQGGTIYDPVSGKTYKCKIRIIDDGKTIKVRGFIGFSLIGRTELWTRVEQ
jgi:uncharacterized protein (DUF2147 family)